LSQYVCQGLIRGARGILKRPALAAGLYLLVVVGVFNTSFERRSTDSGTN
jgi:CRP/FNR family transcriptional regulator, global nitrogen regulator